jgi:hypothetical protein
MDGDLIRWTERVLPERTVEMIIVDNTKNSHRVDTRGLQASPVLRMFFTISTSGLNEWVVQYVSANGVAFVHDLGGQPTGSDVNSVVMTVE